MFFSEKEMLFRIILSALLGGLVGFERERKGRDAGIRTHTLVGLGAAVLAMTQLEASRWVIDFALSNPDASNVISTDITRLTAQVVNGIGFLGAGTIIVSRQTITGLTTAASIWTVAAIGISIGMGNYLLGVSSTVIILIVLTVVKELFNVDTIKFIEIKYSNGDESIKYIETIFEQNHIGVITDDYSIEYTEDGESISKVLYSLHIPRELKMKKIIDSIGEYQSIVRIDTLKQN